MKKFLALILAACLCIAGGIGCGEDTKDTKKGGSTTPSTTPPSTKTME